MATEDDFFAGKPVACGLYEALKKELVRRKAEMLAWIDRAHQFAQR